MVNGTLMVNEAFMVKRALPITGGDTYVKKERRPLGFKQPP
jgi:hypothetical protein